MLKVIHRGCGGKVVAKVVITEYCPIVSIDLNGNIEASENDDYNSCVTLLWCEACSKNVIVEQAEILKV